MLSLLKLQASAVSVEDPYESNLVEREEVVPVSYLTMPSLHHVISRLQLKTSAIQTPDRIISVQHSGYLAPKSLYIMATSSKNKRKREESLASHMENKPDPIIFVLPGMKPDVRLDIFGQHIHVHSLILKLHSHYFRKFLDSPEKSGERASADFQYEYAAAIDDDGSWALEPVDEVSKAWVLEETF